MITNNIKVSFRSFKKYKSSFIINIIGLSSGIACVLFISFWIHDEMRVDKFHKNETQLYQVLSNSVINGEVITRVDSPLLLAENIIEEFPEVESATAINADFATPTGIFTYGDIRQSAKGLFASANFFEVFSFDVFIGDKSQVLDNKHNVVISENLARKLFKTEEDAIGETIDWDYKWTDGSGEERLVVSGVFKTPPVHSTLQFDYIVHSDLLVDADRWAGDWNGHYGKSFLVLKEGTDIGNFNQKIAKYLSNKKEDSEYEITSFVQRFSERYLKEPYENGIQVGGRIVYVRLFFSIALITLLIACINFVNLSTAQATRKMKEVGVKKTLGASRKSLIYQYLSEATILVILSTGVGLLLVFLFLPKFNAITDKNIILSFENNQLLIITLIIVVTGFLAGSYPAFRLSSFKPVTILKGEAPKTGWEFFVRKGLVVFQFVISIVFILSILVVNKQVKYMQTKNLGYNKDNVVQFEIGVIKNIYLLINELKTIPTIESVGYTNGEFLDGNDDNGGWNWSGNENESDRSFQAPRLGYGAIETLGMKIIAGRSFSKDFKDDYNKIILNESALKLMNIEDPIGHLLQKGDDQQEIIGIVKDFQYGSLHKKIEPLIIRFRPYGNNILVKITAGTERETLSKMESVFKKFNPGYSFDYSFMDANYNKLYAAENRVAQLSDFFAVLAIIISSLGLFGLATFTAERRKKEISIRKVLGQSIGQVTVMLSSEFVKLVLIAICIALPISYLLAVDWLSDFAYKIPLHSGYFIGAASIALITAILTVGSQAIRAANENPVKALKEE
ncbi:FtsX-like permease family protein [Spongiivirga sp. MCCC 1A20706]|uniref:ABC transporter permease n=1 Tax=Spongiivirga sp. MCCC 1A20706 TaxID=3160963 RepID=UPI00397789DA